MLAEKQQLTTAQVLKKIQRICSLNKNTFSKSIFHPTVKCVFKTVNKTKTFFLHDENFNTKIILNVFKLFGNFPGI